MVRKIGIGDIKKIVNECVSRLLLEAPDFAKLKAAAQIAVNKGVSKSVGISGALQLERGNIDIHDGKCHLVALSDIMGQNNGGYNTLNPQFDKEMRRIHQNYATAMASHYANSVRDFYSFSNTALNRRWAFTDGNSFIFLTDFGTGRFGSGASGYWVATHFAPDSNMGGYKLLKELFKYDNIIMAVTEHMWEQLAKMGLFYPELSAMVKFAGGYAEKMFFTTDRKLLETEILKGMVKNYQNGNKQAVDAAVSQLLLTKDLYKSLHSGQSINTSNPLANMVFSRVKGYIEDNGGINMLQAMALSAVISNKMGGLKQKYSNMGMDDSQIEQAGDDILTMAKNDKTTSPYYKEIVYIVRKAVNSYIKS